jgi:hypothetical protein
MKRPSEALLLRIQGEYLEMPGLRLTPPQAQRLWGLDRSECETLMSVLVDARFLARTDDGSYVRLDVNSPVTQRGSSRGGWPRASMARADSHHRVPAVLTDR